MCYNWNETVKKKAFTSIKMMLRHFNNKLKTKMFPRDSTQSQSLWKEIMFENDAKMY